MRLTLPVKPFSEALSTAALAIPKSKSLPALTCALVEVDEKQVRVTCDSMDSRISVTLDGHSRDEPFSFLASPRLLKSAMRGDEATLVLRDNRLEIDSWGKTKLSVLPLDEFPKPWEDVPCACAPLNFLAHMNALQAVCRADPSDTYHCIGWHASGHMMATRGHAVLTIPMELHVPDQFLVSSSMMRSTISALKGRDGLMFGCKGSAIHFSAGNVDVWMRLHEGRVPDSRPITPDRLPFGKISREEFQIALEALADFADSDFQRVTLSPGEKFTLSSSNGNDESQILLEVENPTLKEPLVFPRQGLLCIIRDWTCDKIELAGTGPVGLFPCDDSGQTGIILPIRRA